MLNATLIVQIVHLWCAYVIINKLFLKDAVSVIRKEEQEYARLLKTIDQEQQKLSQLQHNKHERWQDFKDIYQTIKPSQDWQEREFLFPKVSRLPLSFKGFNEIKEVCADLLKRKIDYYDK